MSKVKIFLFGLLGLVIIFIIVRLFLPSKFKVKKDIFIYADVNMVFQMVNEVKNHSKWIPENNSKKKQKKKKTGIQFTYNTIQQGKGASYSWKSQNSGMGNLMIIESKKPIYIKTEIAFMKHGKLFGEWYFDKQEVGVKVSRSLYGDVGNGIFTEYLLLFADKIIGPSYEKGLKNLKKLLEDKVIK